MPPEYRSPLGHAEAPERRIKLRFLRKVDVFQDLSEEELKEVGRMVTMTTCPAGKIFYTPDQTGEVLFILKKGRVQVYRMSEEGRKLVIGAIEAGSIFGEMTLVGQGMYDAFAETIEESLICVMNRHDLERILLAKPRVAIRIMEVLATRLRETEETLEHAMFGSVQNRLASLLLRMHRKHPSDLSIDTTHEALAEQLGVYRETVTAALSHLRRDGLISIGHKQIQLLDIPQLEKISKT
jgi:CRP/FNR family cyclic AMP-dependent transcriptional regulator